MPTPQDQEFLRFAVASGHLTQEQADQALAALDEIEALGGAASAPDLLLRRGALNERQVGLVHQAAAASKTATNVPRELGGFELIEKLGQGGMGSVFKARQKDLDRIVALKVLSPRLARSKEFVERFMREARAAGRLNHPNIVAAIDVGESEGFYYLAMEFVEGEPLSRLLARQGRLPEAQALAITLEVARALDHAHAKGLIHRDIKPDNIMVTTDGRVRVTDFGLAKALGRDDPSASDAERFLGTPAYVAPEQIRSEPDIDCRADLFSLGVTLFQMLTGELPFKGAHPMAVAASVTADPLPPLRKLCPELSPAAVRVVERMTAKRREDRYGTPADLIAALEAALAAPQAVPRLPGRAAPARRAAPRRRSSPVGAYIAAAVALLALLAALAYVAATGRHRLKGEEAPPNVGTPIHPATPAQTPAAETAKDLLDRLGKALTEAHEFGRQNPAAYAQRVERWRQVLASVSDAQRRQLPAKGIDLLTEAEAGLKSAQYGRQKAADAELKERNSRADELFRSQKIAEGLRLLDTVPLDLRTEETLAKLETLRTHYRKLAVAEFQTLDDKGKQLVRLSRLDEAKALYLEAKSWNVPEVTEQTKEPLAAIERLLGGIETAAPGETQAAYRQLAQSVLDLLARRDYADARKLADAAAASDRKLAPVRDKVRGLQTLVRAAKEVWDRVVIAAKNLKPGQAIRIRGFAGEFVRFENDQIHWKSGEVMAGSPLSELKPSEAVALLSEAGTPASPLLEPKIALFLLAGRESDAGRRRLQAAKAKGTDVAEESALFDRFAPQVCPACQGAKAVPCPACQGKGYSAVETLPCEACRGKGSSVCSRCNGLGRLRCGNCGGTGRSALGMVCQECGGRRFVDCTACRRGIAECKRCGGTGTLIQRTPCARCAGKRNVPCTACRATGLLPPPDLAAPAEPSVEPPRPPPAKAPTEMPPVPPVKAPTKGPRPEPIDMP